MRIPAAHDGSVHALKFSSISSGHLFSGGQDAQIKLWSVATGQLLNNYQWHSKHILDIAVSDTDDSKFASAGSDRAVILWDTTRAKPIVRWTGNDCHTEQVNSVDFGGSEQNGYSGILASGSIDKTVKLWDCRNNRAYKPIQTLDDAHDSVSAVKISTTSMIISGSIDGKIRVYDIRKGQLHTLVVGHPVTSISLSSYNRDNVLVSSLDGKIRIFNVNDGTIVKEFSGHQNTKYLLKSMFYIPEASIEGPTLPPPHSPRTLESQIVSCSEDNMVYAWDTASTAIVRRFPGSSSALAVKNSSIAYSQESSIVISKN